MTRDDRTHLLFRGSDRTLPWDLIALTHPIVEVKNLPLLKAAFLACIEERHKEIVTVVFDRSMTHESFLEFLCNLPAGFRGDVLMIEDGSKAFLASTTADGRVFFRLERSDLEFYMHARFDLDDPAILQMHDDVMSLGWASAGAPLLAGSYRTN